MNRSVFIWFGGLFVLLLLGMAALSIGSVSISVGEIWQALRAGPGESTSTEHTIIWQLRMPRTLLAFAVGGGLAIIGVAMQALVRNPLAEPYILGVSSGASAGASAFYLGFLPPVLSTALSMPLAAFLGALLAIGVVFFAARTGSRMSTARLLLAGVAVSSFLAAVTAFITYASPSADRIRTVLFWLLGSFGSARWSTIWLPFFFSLGGLAILWALSRPLDALITGEEPAQSLGVPVETLKRLLIFLSAAVTGVIVAASGIIGFVGLIVPHAVRFLIGPSHKRVIPLSFVLGAGFMIAADLVSRTALPNQELPVGILTAICGVPFFLMLLRRTKSLPN